MRESPTSHDFAEDEFNPANFEFPTNTPITPEVKPSKLDTTRTELAEDPLVKVELELIKNDPELESLYADIIEKGDQGRLVEKSAKQVADLSKRYMGKFSPFAFRERSKKIEKLKRFTEFIEGLSPVRSDSRDFAEYKSPELVGSAASYGPQDVVSKSEQFVYGSFTDIGHMMSQGHDQRRLDQADIAPRAQIVMNDVANVLPRTKPDESFMKKYLANLFDYDNGKKILALYLASVFETPEQAKDMLASGGGRPIVAQRWDSLDLLQYRDRTHKANSQEEILSKQKEDEKLGKTFVERMKKLLEDTGIEPPLSLEVRVKDTAKQAA